MGEPFQHIENSQNVVTGNINANGDVMVGGNKTINIYHSTQWKDLEKELKESNAELNKLRERLDKYKDDPELVADFQKDYQATYQKHQVIESNIATFKTEVLQLAKTFTQISLNTKRLKQAYTYFKEGKFKEADVLLKAADLTQDQTTLLKAKERHEQEGKEIEESLQNNANELFLKAQLTAINFGLGDKRVEQTITFFEQALQSYESFEILFEYAYFLQKHNKFNRAVPIYEKALKRANVLHDVANTLNNLGNLQSDKNELTKAEVSYHEALEIYRKLSAQNPDVYLPGVANTLNNLGNLQSDKNELAKAEESYREALKMRRKLVAQNPDTYLPDVATTLHNLGVLQSRKNELAKAEEFYRKALKVRRKLAAQNPDAYLLDVATTLNNLGELQRIKNELAKAEESYREALKVSRKLAVRNPDAYLPDVAMTLNNLGNLQSDKNELATAEAPYGEALEIYRKLAVRNPDAYLPDVAMTLNNLGALQEAKNELVKAEESYQEALKMRRKLAAQNPDAYLPDMTTTLINLSIFYQESKPNKQLSLSHVEEAIILLLPFLEQVPYTQKYFQAAIHVIQDWKIDPEEYLNNLLET